MKRALLGLGIGGVIFAGVYGFAASLGVTSHSLGAGSDVVAACQPSATGNVTVSYTTVYNPGGYQAPTVTVGNIDSNCNGKAMKVTLTGSANASLGEQTASAATGTTTLSFSGVNASAVTGVHVVIAG